MNLFFYLNVWVPVSFSRQQFWEKLFLSASEPPANLVPSDRNDTSLTYQWDMSRGATSYFVALVNAIEPRETNETSVTFDSLSPSTGYNFSIIAFNGFANSSQATDSTTTSTYRGYKNYAFTVDFRGQVHVKTLIK